MTAADMERWDVPLDELVARADAYTVAHAAKRWAEATAENRHLSCVADPVDTAFASHGPGQEDHGARRGPLEGQEQRT
ncbi:hypothetical protein ACFV6B_04315 [Streptomyces microflavus]|uniref:hypothetical protein n=1 Tax=Streptomyces microflavus TaxID=1919 RepID=UPI001A2FB649|nr:hypothetical protein [Streptomyces sp. MBT57]